MSAPDRIWAMPSDDGWMAPYCGNAPHDGSTEYLRADLCAPQDARVQAMVEAAIAEDTATNRRATSREHKQYLRGRIEALKDLRAALRDMKGSE